MDMKELIDFASNPVVAAFLGSAFTLVLSSAAHALPKPEPGNDKTYRFWYAFVQNLMANRGLAKEYGPGALKNDKG
jgi:hypothetical protein